MILSKEARDARIELSDGFNARVKACSSAYKGVESSISALSDLISGILNGNPMGGKGGNCDKESVNVNEETVKFLAEAMVLSYLGYLPNNSNLSDVRAENEKRLVQYKAELEKINGEIESRKNKHERCDTFERQAKVFERDIRNIERVDFQFGWSDIQTYVGSACANLTMSGASDAETESRLTSSLLSGVRNVTPDEYVQNRLYEKDIYMVYLLGLAPVKNYVEEVKAFLHSETAYNSVINNTVINILGVYKYLYQDSFGLRPYNGLLARADKFSFTIDDKNRLSFNKAEMTLFATISQILFDKNMRYNDKKIEVCLDRQFDIRKMVYNSSKLYYYPVKALEYAMGRELTTDLSVRTYRPHVAAIGWETYEQAYVRPQMTDYCEQIAYYALEKCTADHLANANADDIPEFLRPLAKDFSFDSQEFSDIVRDEEKWSAMKIVFIDIDIRKAVERITDSVQRSLCNSACIVSYNNMKGRFNSIALRVVDTTGTLSPNITKDLFDFVTINDKVEFEPADNIVVGKEYEKVKIVYPIYEYRHDFDAALTDAEPLFGYKAVELLTQRGVTIGWDKILIGEDTKGTPIFASLDADDLNLQTQLVHNIIAGSRSGKGVTTMNLLCSALAAKKAIFYIDRKPDMAVMLYEMTKGNMFVVNGGQYVGTNDPRGIFRESEDGDGVAIRGWREAYQSLPEYLKGTLFKENYYSDDGAFGDMVYFRAVLLMFCIIAARVDCKDNPEIYEALGGKRGIVMVFDEYKNWQLFESKYFSADSVFYNKNRITATKDKEFFKLKEDIKSAEIDLSQASDEAKAAKIQLKIESLKRQLQNCIKPINCYCDTLTKKYALTVSKLFSLRDAGLNQNEDRFMDIFLIGQDIETGGYFDKSGTFTTNKDWTYKDSVETRGKSLTRGVLQEIFTNDWTMGYNIAHTEYLHAQDTPENTSPSKKWLTQRKYWCFFKGDTGCEFLEQIKKSLPNGAKFFKTYLVLNNALESDPENPPMVMGEDGKEKESFDYTFVSQCRNRVNEAVPGSKPPMWETVRKKHLTDLFSQDENAEELYEVYLDGYKNGSTGDRQNGNPYWGRLNAGVGFEGLVSMVAQSGGSQFNPELDLKLSLEIGNYVASAMGYDSVRDLLFDFSENGLFSAEDVIMSLKNPGYFKNKEVVLKDYFKKYGFIGEDVEASGEGSQTGGSYGYDNPFLEKNYSDEDFIDPDEQEQAQTGSGSGDDSDGGYGGANTGGNTGGFHFDTTQTIFDDEEEPEYGDEYEYDDEEDAYSDTDSDSDEEYYGGQARLDESSLRMIAETFAENTCFKKSITRQQLGEEKFQSVVDYGMKFLRGCGL